MSPTTPTSERTRRRAEEIFLEIADCPTDEVGVLVDRHCGGDEALRREVDRLLAEDRAVGGFLEVDPTDPLIGAEFHDFRIVRRLGQGGFGVVYRAEQLRPVQRPVAMKVLRPGMNSPQIIARFEAERQTLARMEHPGIARLIAAGQTTDDRMWVAMELVEGAPIDAFCDRERLDISARLRLFIEVCEAVQHAHQRGVIHRDLKPSNILVARPDGSDRPVSRIIDFGVAKALLDDATTMPPDDPDATVFMEPDAMTTHATAARGRESRTALGPTVHGQMIGTPEFMSPEQAAGDLTLMDTRTDIYALGVVLYYLLAGVLPFDPKELRQGSLADVRRRLLESDPPRPSTRLRRLPPDTRDACARRRGVDAHRIVRRLRGDLDWIVAKAMARNREDRYASASELAADVTRHLEGAAVLAGSPGVRYRAWKFVRRNRTAVAAAMFVTIAVTLGLIGTAWGLVAAQRERDVAMVSAEAAIRSAAAAQRQSYNATIAATIAAIGSGDSSAAIAMLDSADAEQRGWEWSHLQARVDRSAVAVQVDDGSIHDLHVEPDGSVLTGGISGRLHRLRPDGSVELLATLEGEIRSIDADPASGLFLVALTNVDGSSTGDRRAVVAIDRDDGSVRWRLDGAVAGSHAIDRSSATPTTAAVATPEPPELLRVALADGAVLARVPVVGRPSMTAVEPDGTFILSTRHRGSHFSLVSWRPDGDIENWDSGSVFERQAIDPIIGRVHFTVWTDGHGAFADWRTQRIGKIAERTGFDRVALATDRSTGLIAVGEGSDIILWEEQQERLVERLSGHRGSVRVARFSDDGSTLASADAEGEVRLWPLPAVPSPLTIDSPSRWATRGSAVASTTGRVVTGTWGAVRIWNAVTGDLERAINHGGHHVDRVAIDPSGTRAVIWGRDFGPSLIEFDGDGPPIHLIPEIGGDRSGGHSAGGWRADGRTFRFVTTAASDDGVNEFIDIEIPARAGDDGRMPPATLLRRRPLDPERPTTMPLLAELGDTSIVVLGDERGILLAIDDDGSRRVVHDFGPPAAIATDPPRRRIAVIDRDGVATMLDADTATVRWRRELAALPVAAAAFSKDGTRLAIAAGIGRIEMRETIRGDLVATLPHDAGSISSIAFLDDDAALVAGSRERAFITLDGVSLPPSSARRRADVHRVRTVADRLYSHLWTSRRILAADLALLESIAPEMITDHDFRDAVIDHVRRRGDHLSSLTSNALQHLRWHDSGTHRGFIIAALETLRLAEPDGRVRWDPTYALAHRLDGEHGVAQSVLREWFENALASESPPRAIDWALLALIERSAGDEDAALEAWRVAQSLGIGPASGTTPLGAMIVDEALESFGRPLQPRRPPD